MSGRDTINITFLLIFSEVATGGSSGASTAVGKAQNWASDLGLENTYALKIRRQIISDKEK